MLPRCQQQKSLDKPAARWLRHGAVGFSEELEYGPMVLEISRNCRKVFRWRLMHWLLHWPLRWLLRWCTAVATCVETLCKLSCLYRSWSGGDMLTIVRPNIPARWSMCKVPATAIDIGWYWNAESCLVQCGSCAGAKGAHKDNQLHVRKWLLKRRDCMQLLIEICPYLSYLFVQNKGNKSRRGRLYRGYDE